MVTIIRFGTQRDSSEQILHQNQKYCHESRDNIHTGSDGQTDTGSHPDTRSGGQTSDIASHLDNNAGTQEGNTTDSLGRDPGRISSSGTESFHNTTAAHVSKSIFGNKHDQGCRTADDYMRPDTCLLKMPASLKADHASHQKSKNQPQTELRVL